MELKVMKNPPVAKIEGLSKNFNHVTALKDVNLEIPEGRIIGLLGPNGSGKTTLLKILSGFCTNYQGNVTIDGLAIGAKTKSIVAYMPDKNGLPPNMTISEVVKLYETFFDDFSREKCENLFSVFGIDPSVPSREMSKGMVDKVQICLLMSRNARLYLLDEPLGGVDVEAREHVLGLILENFSPKSSMIIVTHLIHDIERLFDSAIVLKNGAVAAYDDCDRLRAQYGGGLEDAVREIIHG